MVDEFTMFGTRANPAQKLIISCPDSSNNILVDAENGGNAIMLSSPGSSIAPHKIQQAIVKLVNDNPIREIVVLLHTGCFASEPILQALKGGKRMDQQAYSLFAEPFKENQVVFSDKRHLETRANQELQSLLMSQLIGGWQAQGNGFSRTMRVTFKLHDSAEKGFESACTNLLVANPSRWHYEYLLEDVSETIGREFNMQNSCVLQPPDPAAIKFLVNEKGIKYVALYAAKHEDLVGMKKLMRDLSEKEFVSSSSIRLYMVNKPPKIRV